MARKKRSSKKSNAIPVAVVAPLVFTGYDMVSQFMGGNRAYPQYALTGVNANGNFNSGRLVQTYGPIAAGVVMHKIASNKRVGLNRIVSRATMGFFTI